MKNFYRHKSYWHWIIYFCDERFGHENFFRPTCYGLGFMKWSHLIVWFVMKDLFIKNFFRHKSDRLMSKPLSCIICDERFVDKTLLWPKKIWAHDHERMKPLDCMIWDERFVYEKIHYLDIKYFFGHKSYGLMFMKEWSHLIA